MPLLRSPQLQCEFWNVGQGVFSSGRIQMGDVPMIAPASTLVLFNKTLRILPINVGRTNVQNSLDFVTALLVDRHKRGRLRHRGGRSILPMKCQFLTNHPPAVQGRRTSALHSSHSPTHHRNLATLSL